MKNQYPFRYEDNINKDIDVIFRLQYQPKNKNKAITQAVKIASAFIKSIDPNKALDPDTIKDIIKEKLGLEGKDLK